MNHRLLSPLLLAALCACGTTPSATDNTTSDAPCVRDARSNLPGVSIAITTERCAWTRAEAAKGITFTYVTTVEEEVTDVASTPQDAGGCGRPEASGLIPFPTVKGGSNSWCICDEGNCPDYASTATLPAGTTTGSFTWDGVNWGGPSDTMNPKGDPFPAGAYTVQIEAKGTRAEAPFSVSATLDITLTD